VPTVGIALGGGGVRGFAHVLAFEALEELGITPHRIAGTSMGAILGALYASGVSARVMRSWADEFGAPDRGRSRTSHLRSYFATLGRLADPRLGHGGLFKGEKVSHFLAERAKATTFEELNIPLKIVAADYWNRVEVVLERGKLMPAINASMAIPVVFEPVSHEGRLLVDGGLVNPVPYDRVMDECEVTIAIDAIGRRSQRGDSSPTVLEALANAFQIAQKTIMDQKIAMRPPDVYLLPEIKDVEALDFHKLKSVLEQAASLKEDVKREVHRVLA
jgi:NTE family protein